MSTNDLQNKTLEIQRLRNAQKYRVIPRLDPPFQDPDPTTGVFRGIGQHLGKNALAHMMRARTSNKDAARPEQTHGPYIDLLVSAQGAFEAFLVFGETGRIENDGVVARSFFMALAKEVEGIRLDTFDVFQPVPFRVASGLFHGSGRDVHGLDLFAPFRNLYRKTTGVRKRIQRVA